MKAREENPRFGRFDICEAYSVWAHDFGEYAVITRLRKMGFRLSPLRESVGKLEPNGRAIYRQLARRSLTKMKRERK